MNHPERHSIAQAASRSDSKLSLHQDDNRNGRKCCGWCQHSRNSVHPATMPFCLESQILALLNARTDALRRIETMHHDECSSLSCYHLDSSWFASTQPRIVPSNRIYPRLIDCRRMD